jgi:hypothetical protein
LTIPLSRAIIKSRKEKENKKMKVNYEFKATTDFAQLNIGDVFFYCGNIPYMKIETVSIEEPIYGGDYDYVEKNVINLTNGLADWFDDEIKITPCPNATISF